MEPELDSTIKKLFELRNTDVAMLRYNPKQEKWQQYYGGNLNTSTHIIQEGQPLTTLTFNVLFDNWKQKDYKENILYSEQRYRYTLDKIKESMPHVVGLNQVTKTFYNMLIEQQWIQKHYWLSKFPKKGFSNIIMTRLQPIFMDKIYVHKLPRPIQSIFLPIHCKTGLKIYCFCAMHLIALSTNAHKRKQQFNQLMQYMKRYEHYVEGFVLQGDMNFHSEDQNQIYMVHGLRDAWMERYDVKGEPGYTFDASKNWLINQLYWGFERRKMRLDRILYSSSNMEIKDIKIVFNEPIFKEKEQTQIVKHHWFGKGSLLFINDYFGWSYGRSPKQTYLFPSDHFGLQATISIH